MNPFQWPPIALGGISWRSELGPLESPKACIIDFNFGCFETFLEFFGPDHIFYRNVSRNADVTCNVAHVLGTIYIASKSL